MTNGGSATEKSGASLKKGQGFRDFTENPDDGQIRND